MRSPGARVSSSSSRRIAASRASGPGGQASAPSVLITGMSTSRMMRCWRAQDRKVMTCRRVVGPVANHCVEIVLGAFTQLPSAAVQPGQERDRHGEALLGPLVGAVAERRRGGAAGPQVAQQAPAEEPFEQLAVLGIADAVELGGGPALEVGKAPVAGRQRAVPDQQRAQVFDGAVRPDGIQGGVAAGDAVTGPGPARSRALSRCGAATPRRFAGGAWTPARRPAAAGGRAPPRRVRRGYR